MSPDFIKGVSPALRLDRGMEGSTGGEYFAQERDDT